MGKWYSASLSFVRSSGKCCFLTHRSERDSGYYGKLDPEPNVSGSTLYGVSTILEVQLSLHVWEILIQIWVLWWGPLLGFSLVRTYILWQLSMTAIIVLSVYSFTSSYPSVEKSACDSLGTVNIFIAVVEQKCKARTIAQSNGTSYGSEHLKSSWDRNRYQQLSDAFLGGIKLDLLAKKIKIKKKEKKRSGSIKLHPLVEKEWSTWKVYSDGWIKYPSRSFFPPLQLILVDLGQHIPGLGHFSHHNSCGEGNCTDEMQPFKTSPKLF